MSLAEMKRLYGDRADATDVPGMELDTVSKYRRDFGHLDVEMTFDDPQMYRLIPKISLRRSGITRVGKSSRCRCRSRTPRRT
jgi:hypothetical protein